MLELIPKPACEANVADFERNEVTNDEEYRDMLRHFLTSCCRKPDDFEPEEELG